MEVALRLFENRRQKLRLAQWVKLSIEGREIRVAKDLPALGEIAKLDGCYVLKTDLATEAASKETARVLPISGCLFEL